MKKKWIVLIALVSVLALGGVGVLAAGQIAKSGAISEENARNFALADAGVSPENAVFYKTDFEYFHGHFVYDIEFRTDDQVFDYDIDANDGSVIEKEVELIAAEPASKASGHETPSGGGTGTQEILSQAEVKEIALTKAGLAGKQVTFVEVKYELEEGAPVYELEFFYEDAGEIVKYEYDVDAVTGTILSEDVAHIRETPTGTTETKAAPEGTTSQGEKTTKKEEPARQEETTEREETATKSSAEDASRKAISLEEAKEIALKDAGVSASKVTFSKAKQDHENGKLVYEIDFYIRGEKEYDYEIDAYSGKILDRDVEAWEEEDD